MNAMLVWLSLGSQGMPADAIYADTMPDVGARGETVFCRQWGHDGELRSDLYIADLEGSNIRRLTTGLYAIEPRFAPDGRHIVLTHRETHWRNTMGHTWEVTSFIHRIDRDGTRLQRLFPGWSPHMIRTAGCCSTTRCGMAYGVCGLQTSRPENIGREQTV